MPTAHRGPHAAFRLESTLAAALLTLCVLLGGTTTQGNLADGALVIFGCIALAVCLLRRPPSPMARDERLLMLWMLATVGWLALQLVPLPPAIWTSLSGREPAVEALTLAGTPLGWRPIALDREAALRAALAWIPLFALALCLARIDGHARRRLLKLAVLLAVGSALLGLAQLSAGQGSPLRWHEVTNDNAAVGPFANRNHLASLLAAVLAIGVAWLLDQRAREYESRRLLGRSLVALAVLVLVVGLAMTRSRAGVALGCVALLGAGLLFIAHARERSSGHGRPALGWLAITAGTALFFVIQFALVGLIQRFEHDPLEDDRWRVAQITRQAIDQHGALGIGAGGFVPVFAASEPSDQRSGTYVNRAHNDWLEWRLEGGYPLVLLIGLGVVWLAWRVVQLWRHDGRHAPWARAASLGVIVVLLHSAFDYPLRTLGMAAVFVVLVGGIRIQSGGRPGQV